MTATARLEATPRIGLALAEVAERVTRSTVQVGVRGRGAGAGVIWSADGAIITNAHVCSEGRATVTLAGGETVEAEVAACDPRRDLALLRAEAGDLAAAAPGASDALRVGELVLAVGSPWGVTNALAAGIVHATGGRWVRADIRLAPGNSGGPLANARGEVVGINSMIAGGLALAVPSGAVARFLREGSRPPRLGVRLQPVAVAFRGARAAGLIVTGVEAGSPAESSGVVTGDVIVGSAGASFTTAADLAAHLADSEPGVMLPLDIVRAGRRVALEVPPRTGGARAAA